MTQITLEHVNISVSDAKATAMQYCELFDWHIRWEGPAMDNGYTVHVGNEAQYIAVYSPSTPQQSPPQDHRAIGTVSYTHLTLPTILLV